MNPFENGSVIVYFGAAVLAGYFSLHMWQGKYDTRLASTRDPAAINRNFDFSNLQGNNFLQASRKRLLKDARIIQGTDSVGIELGHFVARSRGGKRAFACHIYDKIELKFVAADTATHGHPTSMIIDTRCEISSDISRMNPIWIPMSKILGQPVGEIELLFLEKTPLAVRFQNVDSDWPLMWNLNSIRLYSTMQKDREVNIDQETILELRNGPIAFSWEH